MLNQTIQNKISYLPTGGFLIFYIYILIFHMNTKMQNKPKLHAAKIALSPCIKADCRKPEADGSFKNKPKQTQMNHRISTLKGDNQIKARRRESPDYSRHVTCPAIPNKMTNKNLLTPASSRQLGTSIVPLSKNSLQNKKMTNEPNF